MFATFGGIYAQFFSAPARQFPIIHIGDQTAASGFGFHQGFSDQVVVTVMATEAVRDELENFYEPLSKSIGFVVIPSIAENFAVGGRPPWAPLAPSTVERWGKVGPVLMQTGAMMNAVTSIDSWIITHTDAWLDDNAMPKYAEFHQQGTRLMPQREFCNYQDSDRDLIETIFAEWVEGIIGNFWGDWTIF